MAKKFEEMITKLSPTLRRITHKLNGHFTFFDEDDLFQEALEHLWTAFRDGTLGDNTDSYVLQGCYFHLKNYIRKTIDKTKLVSMDAVIDDDGSTIEDVIPCNDNSAENAADTMMLNDAMKLSALSEKETMILSMTLDGMTVREIGRSLGISHVMVVKIKGRIREKCEALRINRGKGYQN